MSTSLPVDRISDTAFLTALYRALESERQDANFQDPFARDLAGDRGEQLSLGLGDENSVAKGCAIRTCIFDEVIVRIVEQHGIDLVLNLAAGLDTRPYRLPLPSGLRWIECDQEEVLAYKAHKLSSADPVCPLDSLTVDITDKVSRQSLFERIPEETHEGFVITEGILIYMAETQVASLAESLGSQPKLRWWLADLASPIALQQFQKVFAGKSENDETKMQFAPRDQNAFFHSCGWEIIEFHSLVEEGHRLKRSILPLHIRAQASAAQWEIIRHLSGVVLLKRTNS